MFFKKKGLWILLVPFWLLYSCENDIDLYDYNGPVPAVTCLLDPQSNIQFLRLSRTFNLDKDQSQDIIPDSCLWNEETDIYIEHYVEGKVAEIFNFYRNDVIEKDTGFFPIAALEIFEAQFKPVPGDRYCLYVHFPKSNRIVSGETIVMYVPKLLDPAAIPTREITFDSISPYVIRWVGTEDAGLYQGVFKLHILESEMGKTNNKTILFKSPLYSEIGKLGIIEKPLNGMNFYKDLADQLDEITDGYRQIINLEYEFYSTGVELALQVDGEMNSGNLFTNIRSYTNVIGGTGIFSSVCINRVANLRLSSVSMRYLIQGELTDHLGFIMNGQ